MKKIYMNVEQLRLWNNNPRNIEEKDFNRLKKQIQKLGQYKPLLITSDGEVIGGNMRLRAYKELKIKKVWVSIVEPKDESEKMEYALSDNDRVGYYDDDMLANLMPELDIKWGDYAIDLKPPKTLDELLPQEVEEDDPPEVEDGKPVSKLGEVYQLGRHRLMCGDATKEEDVEKLMDGKRVNVLITDPPYGIDIVDKKGSIGGRNLAPVGKYSKIINDDTTETAKKAYFLLKNLGVEKFVIWGGNYFTEFLPPSSCWIVWDKRGDIPSNNFADCEIAWTSFNTPSRIYRQVWRGMIKEGESGKRLHPTQKPVRILADIIQIYTKLSDDIVLDTFGGSGSTLIACEQTNRTCYMMELDPHYCDVIRRRYAKFIEKEDEWQKNTPKT